MACELSDQAHGGTLRLDDVNDLPAGLQAKLFDVLQRNVVRAVGSDRESSIDARIMAESNQPLQTRMASDIRIMTTTLCTRSGTRRRSANLR
jgi:DNA-binding NtrC family response regulator